MDNTCTVIIRTPYFPDRAVTFTGVTNDELEILIAIVARTNSKAGALEMLITPEQTD